MAIKNLINDINKLYHIFYDGNEIGVTNITSIKECKRLANEIKDTPNQNHSKEVNLILSYLKETNKILNEISTDKKDSEFTNTKQHVQNIINDILTNN